MIWNCFAWRKLKFLFRSFLIFIAAGALVSCTLIGDSLKSSTASYDEPSSGAMAKLRVMGKGRIMGGSGGSVRLYAGTSCVPSRPQAGDGFLFSTHFNLNFKEYKKTSDGSAIPKGYIYTEVNISAGRPLTFTHTVFDSSYQTHNTYTFFPNVGKVYLIELRDSFNSPMYLTELGKGLGSVEYSRTSECAN